MPDTERIARLRRAFPEEGWSAIDLDAHLLAIVRMIDAAEALTSDVRDVARARPETTREEAPDG